MCGIGGQVLLDKKKSFTKEQSINALSLLLSLQKRGESAWGMYLEKNKNNTHLYCGELDTSIPGELFKTPSSPKVFFDNGSTIYFSDVHTFLVHTRAPTQGPATVNENNHPFNTENFVLAHNGAVNNDAELLKTYNIKTDIQCDSFPIVAMIQHFFSTGKTVVESINEMSKVLRGNYACWLYHKDTGDLYLFRNSQPISYYIDKKNNVMMFASLEDYILSAYLVDTDQMRDAIKSLDTNVIYKLENGEMANVGKLEEKKYDNCNTVGHRPSTFTSDTIDEVSESFEYLYELFETYEKNENDPETVIAITPRGEVDILVRPAALLSILDKGGFKPYKSTTKLYDSDYYEYIINTIEIFHSVVRRLQKALDDVEGEDDDNDDDDDTPTNHGINSTPEQDRFLSSLRDLAETLNCKLEITPKHILLKYPEDKDLPEMHRKLFKKVGFAFRKDNTMKIRNNKHHRCAFEAILTRVKLKDPDIVIDVSEPAPSTEAQPSQETLPDATPNQFDASTGCED
jgi:hypothetical protein